MRLLLSVLLVLQFACRASEITDSRESEAPDRDSHFEQMLPATILVGTNPDTLNGRWDPEIVPDVIACSSLHISETRLRSAVALWERLGYRFGEVRVDDNSYSCTNRPRYFEIVIDLPDAGFDWNYLARTRVYKLTETKEILWATIKIQQTAVTKPRVLEHEIGHALGWPHFGRRGHLMNALWQNGGYNTAGLQARYYNGLPVFLLPLSPRGNGDY